MKTKNKAPTYAVEMKIGLARLEDDPAVAVDCFQTAARVAPNLDARKCAEHAAAEADCGSLDAARIHAEQGVRLAGGEAAVPQSPPCPGLAEEVTKAAQTASLLVGDVREAHRQACAANTAAGDLAALLLLDVIGEARRLADRVKTIQGAMGGDK